MFLKFFYATTLMLFFISCTKRVDTPSQDIELSIYIHDYEHRSIEKSYVIVSVENENNRAIRVAEDWVVNERGLLSVQVKSVKQGTTVELRVFSSGYEPEKINYIVKNVQKDTIHLYLERSSSLSVLSYNVFEGFQNNKDNYNEFSKWVENYDTDIILFQEMNNFTEQSLSEFAKSFGHNYSILLRRDGFPTAITSRFPIINATRVLENQRHGYIYAKINNIHVFSVHLIPHGLEKQIEEGNIILNHIMSLPKGENIILGGDFNSYNSFDAKIYPPFIKERKKYESHLKIDNSVTNAFLKFGLKDSYALLNTMFKATTPVLNNTNNSSNQGKRIDYIFLDENLANNCVYSDVLQNKFTDYASDHYPVYIRVKLD